MRLIAKMITCDEDEEEKEAEDTLDDEGRHTFHDDRCMDATLWFIPVPRPPKESEGHIKQRGVN